MTTMRRRSLSSTSALAFVGLAAVLGVAGCSGDGGTPVTSSQAVHDQRVLEEAGAQMLQECKDSGGVEPQDAMVAAANIIEDRPNENLPTGMTTREIGRQIIADIKACGTNDAEFVEMMFTPGSGETSFERERRERAAMLAGEADPSQPLFRATCQTITERGETVAGREFIDSTPYGEIGRARAVFPEIVATCAG